MKFQVYTYDVWGNSKDGFEVNDVYKSDTIELPADPTDQQIISELKQIGIIRKGFRFANFDIDGESDFTLYVTYSPMSYPVCELRKV